MKRWRDALELAPPTPMRCVASALGSAVAGLPSLSPHADARALALAGVVAMLATTVVAKPGVATFGCAAGMAATGAACVHGAPAALPVGVALLLLGYLLVADVAAAPGELRAHTAALVAARMRLFGAGTLAVLALAALALAGIGGPFALAIAAVVAAMVAVAAVRGIFSQ